MNVTIALCTLCACIGLPLGYYLGWAMDQADAWLEARLDGSSEIYWMPEWR